MPNPAEVAEIVVNGTRFRDWTTFKLEMDYKTLTRSCTFTATEDAGKTGNYFKVLRIKPGDVCQVLLAGQRMLTGYVYNRQASYNAHMHGVMLTAASKTGDLTQGSVPMKDTQFRNNAFPAIAKKLMAPFGLDLKVTNPPPGFDKKFRSLSAFPGESVWSFLERAGRMRGLFLHDDESGNVVARQGTTDGGAMLQEGRNILEANCVINDERLFSKLVMYGQHSGHDQRWGDEARNPAAEVNGQSQRYREKHLPLEDQSDDGEDVRRRAAHERNELEGAVIEATIKTQGWHKPGGGLWNFGERITVNSPMLLLENHTLAVKSVIFQQDNAGGTTTMLSLCLPQFLSSLDSTSANGGTGNLLPGSRPSPARTLNQ